MIQKALLHYQLPQLTCVGLLLFMMVFGAALVWVFRRGSSSVYTGLEGLPLRDLEVHFKGEDGHVEKNQ